MVLGLVSRGNPEVGKDSEGNKPVTRLQIKKKNKQISDFCNHLYLYLEVYKLKRNSYAVSSLTGGARSAAKKRRFK